VAGRPRRSGNGLENVRLFVDRAAASIFRIHHLARHHCSRRDTQRQQADQHLVGRGIHYSRERSRCRRNRHRCRPRQRRSNTQGPRAAAQSISARADRRQTLQRRSRPRAAYPDSRCGNQSRAGVVADRTRASLGLQSRSWLRTGRRIRPIAQGTPSAIQQSSSLCSSIRTRRPE
jgi:hypothetical protein